MCAAPHEHEDVAMFDLVLTGAVGLGLAVYLVFVLLRPEKF
jgi:K+-transporting ATPase KdpF subunit